MQIKPSKLRGLIIAVSTTLALTAGLRPTLATENGVPVAEHSRALIFGTPEQFREALTARGRPDVMPAMVLALRYNNGSATELSRALEALTGHSAYGWFDWMVWQEQHPEITPHASYTELKLEILQRIDPVSTAEQN